MEQIALDYGKQVDKLFDREEDKEELFNWLRLYNERNLPVNGLVSSMRSIVSHPDQLTLFEISKCLIRHDDLSEYESCVPEYTPRRTKSVLISVLPNEKVGLSLRGGMEHKTGLMVVDVEPGSAAGKCGVSIGDELLRVNGYSLKFCTHKEAISLISRHKIMLALQTRHMGMIPVPVAFQQKFRWVFPDEYIMRRRSPYSEVMKKKTPKEICKERRVILKSDHSSVLGFNIVDTKSGVFVSAVKPQTPADAAGIIKGDEIVQVNDVVFRKATTVEIVSALKQPGDLEIVLKASDGIRSRSSSSVSINFSEPPPQNINEFENRIDHLFEKNLAQRAKQIRMEESRVMSEVGFEPTPPFGDQNTQLPLSAEGRADALESGALDHSAILTTFGAATSPSQKNEDTDSDQSQDFPPPPSPPLPPPPPLPENQNNLSPTALPQKNGHAQSIIVQGGISKFLSSNDTSNLQDASIMDFQQTTSYDATDSAFMEINGSNNGECNNLASMAIVSTSSTINVGISACATNNVNGDQGMTEFSCSSASKSSSAATSISGVYSARPETNRTALQELQAAGNRRQKLEAELRERLKIERQKRLVQEKSLRLDRLRQELKETEREEARLQKWLENTENADDVHALRSYSYTSQDDEVMDEVPSTEFMLTTPPDMRQRTNSAVPVSPSHSSADYGHTKHAHDIVGSSGEVRFEREVDGRKVVISEVKEYISNKVSRDAKMLTTTKTLTSMQQRKSHPQGYARVNLKNEM